MLTTYTEIPQIIVNGICSGLSYALIALGFGIIYRAVRFFHFAHGAIYTTGADFAYASTVLIGMGHWLGFGLAILGAALLGAFIEIAVYKPLRNSRSSSLAMLLVSLGIFVVIQNAISIVFGDSAKILRSGIAKPGFVLFGAHITPIQIVIIIASILLCSVVWAGWRFSRIGKIIRAVSDDPELVRVVGIDADRAVLFIFLIGSMLSGIAGILSGYDADLTPSMGFNALLMGVVVVIIGGVGSIPGIILGGVFLGLVQHLGGWILPTQWQEAIVFVILALFLLLRPQGFFGDIIRKSAV